MISIFNVISGHIWNIHFNMILLSTDIVDPNRDGYVSLQEYMAFMISKETENVQSSEEIENAFRAITAADRPYVTKEELYAVSIANTIVYLECKLQCFYNHKKCNLYFFNLFFSRTSQRRWLIIALPV